MKELSIIEMNDVSGSYSWNFGSFASVLESVVTNTAEAVASAALGAITYGWAGSIIGGTQGGNGGGILGVGSIGQGVGMIYGGVTGAIGGAVAGALNGWSETQSDFNEFTDNMFSGTF